MNINKLANGILEKVEKATPLPYYADGKDVFALEKKGGANGLHLYAKMPVVPKEGEIAPPSFAVQYIEGAHSIAYLVAAANAAPELARAVLELKSEMARKDRLIEQQDAKIDALIIARDLLEGIREWVKLEAIEYADTSFSDLETVQDIYRRLQTQLGKNQALEETNARLMEMVKVIQRLGPIMDELVERVQQVME